MNPHIIQIGNKMMINACCCCRPGTHAVDVPLSSPLLQPNPACFLLQRKERETWLGIPRLDSGWLAAAISIRGSIKNGLVCMEVSIRKGKQRRQPVPAIRALTDSSRLLFRQLQCAGPNTKPSNYQCCHREQNMDRTTKSTVQNFVVPFSRNLSWSAKGPFIQTPLSYVYILLIHLSCHFLLQRIFYVL